MAPLSSFHTINHLLLRRNMKSSFSTFPPLNPVRAQRGYPPLSHFSPLFNRNQPQTIVINIPNPNNSAGEERNVFVVSGALYDQNHIGWPWPSMATDTPYNQDVQVMGFQGEAEGEGGKAEAETREEKEAEEGEGEVEEEAEGEGDSSDDPRNPRINGQRLTNPKLAPYALTMVLALLGSVIIVLKQGKHTLRIAKAYMILFVVSFSIAYAAYSIYSWITDRSDYKMLKGIYYIFCTLAFISLLLILYTSST